MPGNKKNYDKNGDWRYVVVGFDVSYDEYAVMKEKAEKKGLSVASYMNERLTDKSVTVCKNKHAYEICKKILAQIDCELVRIGEKEE